MSGPFPGMRVTIATRSDMAAAAPPPPKPITPKNMTDEQRATIAAIGERAATTRGLAGEIRGMLADARIIRRSWRVSDPRVRNAITRQVTLDVMAAHAITPLDLPDLHALPAPAFRREIIGIVENLDRRGAQWRNDHRPATTLEREP